VGSGGNSPHGLAGPSPCPRERSSLVSRPSRPRPTPAPTPTTDAGPYLTGVVGCLIAVALLTWGTVPIPP
jgi:hypothetical protein